MTLSEPIVVTEPALEPLSLVEAREHLRIDADNTALDSRIVALIGVVRSMCEHELGRKLMPQTLEVKMDAFPSSTEAIGLHSAMWRPTSVVQITYIDGAGATQVLPSVQYVLDPYTWPGRIFPADGYSWPSDVSDDANAVAVRVTCGEWTSQASVPQELKQWMLMHLGAMMRFPEALTPDRVSALPDRYVDSLLDRWRVVQPAGA